MNTVDKRVVNHWFVRYRHGRFDKWTSRVLEFIMGMSVVNCMVLYRRQRGEYESGFDQNRRTRTPQFKDVLQRELRLYALKLLINALKFVDDA